MPDRDPDEQPRDGQADAVSTLVDEQVRAARSEVFRAYEQAREKARALGADERPAPRADDRPPRRRAS
ncbi:MAG: hypothetical protein JWR63_3161 [Conexibacter sp.]|nr:hypothetical protein [Conexibacter sp.]